MTAVRLAVNGRSVAAEVEPRQHLADFIREGLLLTGTHLGCEHGVCGACTVLIDGAPARSCIAYPVALEGAAITTIEGLSDDPVMVELREAFGLDHGLQCGFCTPGMLIMARDIVLRRPGASPEAIRLDLAGNLCRCTGYVGIVRAIRRVAQARAAEVPVVTRGSTIAPLAAISPLALPAAHARLAAASRVEDTPRGEAGPGLAPAAAAQGATEESEPLRNPVTLERSFAVAAPRASVWSVLRDPARIVPCVPGARLAEPSDGHLIRAEMRVSLGPIQAAFGGQGVLSLDPATWSGSLEGSGADRASATRARARLTFRLEEAEGGAATRVALTVAYALQGPLAQMSRGALAIALADRLTQAFGANLSALLTGAPPASADPRLKAGALLVAAVKHRISGFWRRV